MSDLLKIAWRNIYIKSAVVLVAGIIALIVAFEIFGGDGVFGLIISLLAYVAIVISFRLSQDFD